MATNATRRVEELSIERRLLLRADRHAPAAVRSVIRQVLEEAQLSAISDDVLLLATELTTNAVLHAGTDLHVTVEVDAARVHVGVADGHRGELPVLDSTSAMRRPLLSHGRGLILVDQIATRWGVVHDNSGKTVWFDIEHRDRPPGDVPGAKRPTRLVRAATIQRDPSRVRDDLGAADGAVLVGADTWLGGAIAADLAQFAARLAGEVSAAAGDAAVEITLDRADGRGDVEVARAGSNQRAAAQQTGAQHTAEPVRIPLPLAPPAQGWLAIHSEMIPAHALQIANLGAHAFAVMVDNDRLRGADLRRRAEVAFITGASDLLAQSLEIDLTMALVPRLFVPRLGEWCAVLRCFDDGLPVVVSATHAREAQTVAVRHALDLAPNKRVLADARNPGQHSTLSAALDGVAVPLIVRGQRLGVLAVGRPRGRRHDADELAVIVDLARRTALALDNAQLHEERRAATDTLRQALLPPALPRVEGVRFAAEYIPAIGTVDVGGDFYDVLEMPDGRWLMVLGDVSGKGVAAAAVTGLVRNVMRVLVREGRPLPEILVRINEELAEQGSGRFATLAVAAVDAGGPTVRAEVYLAGHERPIVVRTSGATESVGHHGSALGLLARINIVGADVIMSRGDTLVFFTDGVTERRRGDELFGLDRTHEVLAPLAGHDADIVAARLRAATMAFSPETPRDDIAILTMRNESIGEAFGQVAGEGADQAFDETSTPDRAVAAPAT